METLMELEAKVKASLSVCKIFYPIVGGSTTASGFRVGSRYIMTAAHVTNNFQKGLQNSDTYVIFNYKYDGIYKRKDKYLIKEVVYSNDETDIAVVELLDHQRVMPPHVTSFCSPVLDRSFHLIGHSKGNVMETNLVTKIIDKDDPKIKFCLDQLQRMSCQHTGGKGYDTPPNDSVHNPYRFLFQCKFTKGASGSPGIVLVGKTIYVTTVLLHGYPDWYYDPTMEVYKNNWLDEHCVQQGVNIMSVCEMMRATHPSLCQDIFGKQQC
ncbi:uncharacterized protein LOC128554082 [Mercenaria mercenaria]|uniref:uncharacterized protein LOC128554082 n=1 Tax=Mercenaria mercenaria TaxID=6596 RepID=UPI00234FB59D|nr:uncharacterized protein LOC128554082 [Mercenaria mercenaria]